MAQQFDAMAGYWDAQHGAASVRAPEFAARIGYLRARCRESGKPRVLDLGCGTGQTLLHLMDVITEGIGVDISEEMISRATQCGNQSRLTFEVADAIEFCSACRERFEIVMLIGALAHFENQAAALAAAGRVTSEGGRVIIISPHPWGPVFLLDRLLSRNPEIPGSCHLSPSQLRWLGTRSDLELSILRALPYAPWPKLSAALGWCGAGRIGNCNPFRGILRGAFAAEFHRIDNC